jgi:hypothetical protein
LEMSTAANALITREIGQVTGEDPPRYAKA